MTQPQICKRLVAICSLCFAVAVMDSAVAQLIRAPLSDGFERSSSVDVSVDEMLGMRKPRTAEEAIVGPGFPALWISEIQYKPVRLMRLPVVDPKTGTTTEELVWYMVWRMIPRDYTELAGEGRPDLLTKLSDPNQDPLNDTDALRANSIQIPRFVLHLEDEGATEQYHDEVNLEIQKAVFQREMGRKSQNLKLLNAVEAIQEVSVPVSNDSTLEPDPLSKAVYGVAVWRNIDPRTDFFSVRISGLTNAYRIQRDASGQQVVEEKIVIQKFERPGDEFLQEEKEFMLNGNPRWEYQARPVQLNVPDLDKVLRNAKSEAAPAGEQ